MYNRSCFLVDDDVFVLVEHNDCNLDDDRFNDQSNKKEACVLLEHCES